MLVEVMQSHLPIITVSFREGLVSIFFYWHLMQDCSGTVGTEYGIIGCHIGWSISCSSSSKSSSQFLGVTYTPMCLFSYKLLWQKMNHKAGS